MVLVYKILLSTSPDTLGQHFHSTNSWNPNLLQYALVTTNAIIPKETHPVHGTCRSTWPSPKEKCRWSISEAASKQFFLIKMATSPWVLGWMWCGVGTHVWVRWRKLWFDTQVQVGNLASASLRSFRLLTQKHFFFSHSTFLVVGPGVAHCLFLINGDLPFLSRNCRSLWRPHTLL